MEEPRVDLLQMGDQLRPGAVLQRHQNLVHVQRHDEPVPVQTAVQTVVVVDQLEAPLLPDGRPEVAPPLRRVVGLEAGQGDVHYRHHSFRRVMFQHSRHLRGRIIPVKHKLVGAEQTQQFDPLHQPPGPLGAQLQALHTDGEPRATPAAALPPPQRRHVHGQAGVRRGAWRRRQRHGARYRVLSQRTRHEHRVKQSAGVLRVPATLPDELHLSRHALRHVVEPQLAVDLRSGVLLIPVPHRHYPHVGEHTPLCVQTPVRVGRQRVQRRVKGVLPVLIVWEHGELLRTVARLPVTCEEVAAQEVVQGARWRLGGEDLFDEQRPRAGWEECSRGGPSEVDEDGQGSGGRQQGQQMARRQQPAAPASVTHRGVSGRPSGPHVLGGHALQPSPGCEERTATHAPEFMSVSCRKVGVRFSPTEIGSKQQHHGSDTGKIASYSLTLMYKILPGKTNTKFSGLETNVPGTGRNSSEELRVEMNPSTSHMLYHCQFYFPSDISVSSDQ